MTEVEVYSALSSIKCRQNLFEFRELFGCCNSYLARNAWSDLVAVRANALLLVPLLIGWSYSK